MANSFVAPDLIDAGHFRRQAKAGHIDLADQAGVLDRLRGGDDADVVGAMMTLTLDARS